MEDYAYYRNCLPPPSTSTYVRAQFPSLAQTVNGHPAAFLDGPGGTQVPQRVIDAIADYLRRDNANTGGAYATSRRTDAMIAEARSAMADFLHCAADEVAFGPNMTTLTYAMSRAIGRELGARRRNRRHAPRPRRQLFPVAGDGRGSRRHRPLGRDPRRRLHARYGRPRLENQFQHEAGRRRIRLERRRHDQSSKRDRAARAQSRSPRLHRRRPLRPARPDRRSSPRLRFSGVLHLQILRPAHGRALRQARAPQAPATLQSPPEHERDSELLGVGHDDSRTDRGHHRMC